MKIAGYLIIAAAVGVGCSKSKEAPPAESAPAAQASDDTSAKPRKKITLEDVARANRYAVEKEWGSDVAKEAYVPAEFKSGKGQWRDATVYVDGKPIGMLWFGELPSTLEPIWVEEEEDIDWNHKTGGPRFKLVKTRQYRVYDYLKAAGVDIDKIKMVHVYGPHNLVVEVTRKQLEEYKDLLRFRFGNSTYGKAIPHIPHDLGNNMDRLMGICVYIDKKVPTKNKDGDLELNGKLIDGVPYYGEPLRGGIRVYKNDTLATVFKRNKMDEDMGTTLADGTVSYKLFDVLKEQGVETDDIVELEIIFDERRTKRFDRAAMEKMTFRSVPQAKGQIQLDKDLFAHSLAFYSKKLPPRTRSQDHLDDE